MWTHGKGKWKFKPMEKENMDPWKRKMEMRTYGKGKGKYGSMEKENGNTDLWKRADGGRPDVCS